MHNVLVILCVLGMGWGVFSKHRQDKEVALPVVSVMPIWLVADTADVVQPTTMARDSLVVSIVCPADCPLGEYSAYCGSPGDSEYPAKTVMFTGETSWQVKFPANDSLLVVVNGDTTFCAGFHEAFDTR